ncbi:hypothetical protein F5884DRAFT_786808 [Xylogone sp. PMI_703]|nr:hypothetical protein F5884DRAFT_786808 [Xylogone sp. PMI_703]
MNGRRDPKIIRTRTGCLTCRRRGKKCDETLPCCINCSRASRTCKYGQLIRFKPVSSKSQQIAHPLQRQDVDFTPQWRNTLDLNQKGSTQTRIESGPAPTVSRRAPKPTLLDNRPTSPSCLAALSSPSSLENLDEHPQTAPEVTSSQRLDSISNMSETAHVTSDTTWRFAEVTSSVWVTDQHMPNIAWSPMASPISRQNHSNEVIHASSATNQSGVTTVITPEEEASLVQSYLQHVGRWMENSDPDRHFTLKCVHEIISDDTCKASILAISSRYQTFTNSNYPSRLSLELYQNAVQKLLNSSLIRTDCGTLVSCVLLAVYEMMTSKYSDWLRHLEGCAALLRSNGWNASTGGLVSSCFWSYAKVDIWAAFCNETTTLIPPVSWFNDSQALLLRRDIEYAEHSTTLVWILARIINFISSMKTQSTYENKTEWADLWRALEGWESISPSSTKPIIRLASGSDQHRNIEMNPFSKIVYASHTSAIAWTMYHTGIVLLLELRELCHLNMTQDKLDNMLYSNAHSACSIISSNPHP